MSLASQVLLRYKAAGHIRFDLPPQIADNPRHNDFLQALAGKEGVYRVDLSSGGKKLSIRYLTAVCSFEQVVQRLFALIGELEKMPASPRRPDASNSTILIATPLHRSRESSLGLWLRTRLEEIRETVQAMKILLSRWLGTADGSVGSRPQWVREFMNDLVMLFMIKLHWHHIVSEWLPKPWTHRYEWAATIYLIYLSVQSRLPQTA